MDTNTLLLTNNDVQKCIDMKQILEIADGVYKAHGESRIIMPAKITLDMSILGIPNWMNAMPAYVQSAHMFGIKWAGGFINNPENRDLPYVMATMILNDPESGLPISIMDAMHITNMRTGASAAIGARYLARTDAKVAAFIGAGVQACMSLQAIALEFQLDEIRAVDLRPEASRFLVDQAAVLGINGRVEDSVEEAVKDAAIIVTATTASKPLIMKDWVKPGAFIAKLGSFQELDDTLTLSVDKIVVDHREQAAHRGELVHLYESGKMTQGDVYTELGKIAAGIIPGREDESEIILGELIGLGSMDVAIGAAVVNRARELGLGKQFNFLA